MQDFEKAITEKVGDTSNLRGPKHDSMQQDVEYPLPARQQADSLLSSYWNYAHVLYPFLSRPQTEEDYDRIWSQESSITDRKSFLCLLNSIFAISSRHVRMAAPNHEHLAALFCLRARELLDVEVCSIRSVQSYLLLALYYQSIDEPRTCWTFTGLAVRAAQILELHIVETSEREPDSRYRDLLCRVWHGCVLMDRDVSMMYDRPCMIDTKTAMAVPLPFLEEETRMNQGPQTHAADFYSVSSGLFNILHDILLQPHSSKSPRYSQTRYTNSRHYIPPADANTSVVVELGERLSRWDTDVPNNYKAWIQSPYPGVNCLLVRRSVVLHQRSVYNSPYCIRRFNEEFFQTSSCAVVAFETYASKCNCLRVP